MIGLIVFTTFFQAFFTGGGKIYWSFWVFQLSSQGLQQAAIIFVRFILIIFFSTLLTLTTMPLSIADAVESLLKPLKIFKLPVHEIGLMLSMSLRFVPTLMDDTSRIMNAQRARGVDFNQGSLMTRIKAVIPILIPLFAASFKRADALAIAMEAKGYQGGDSRSKYRQLNWQFRDSLSILTLLGLAVLMFLLKT